MSVVGYLPDQSQTQEDNVVPYTANPVVLLLSDLKLFFSQIAYFPFILFPIKATQKLDEFYPSPANIYNITFQVILLIIQLLFIVSLLLSVVLVFFVPFGWVVLYIVGYVVLNHVSVVMLNGRQSYFESDVGVLMHGEDHPDERWIFLNGIATGHRGLQINIDQLSKTFGRRILGLHNRTAGIIFDLLQCLIQRDLTYTTPGVRLAYTHLKTALYSPTNTKVVFLLHSQGAIEGGLILDWLLAEMPRDLLRKLEVYTFGNAANHFNNPPVSVEGMQGGAAGNTFRHIEHYANSGDLIARLGVLHFSTTSYRTATANRFMGKVFERAGSGHLLNQHYLDTMFTLGADGRVKERNAFMDSDVDIIGRGGEVGISGTMKNGVVTGKRRGVAAVGKVGMKVRDLSRLWMYRNSMSPPDE